MIGAAAFTLIDKILRRDRLEKLRDLADNRDSVEATAASWGARIDGLLSAAVRTLAASETRL